jgi:hypothetical protein
MSGKAPDLGDYLTVAERIEQFKAEFPDGCLRPVDPAQPYRLETVGERTFVVYVAAAYRTPDDQMPGIGCAWEVFPGKTPYTRDSELMNAETSAFGRAIAALGIGAKRDRDDSVRRDVIGKAVAAIEAAETVEGLDDIGGRISSVEKRGLISGADAVELRRRLVARKDAISGTDREDAA